MTISMTRFAPILALLAACLPVTACGGSSSAPAPAAPVEAFEVVGTTPAQGAEDVPLASASAIRIALSHAVDPTSATADAFEVLQDGTPTPFQVTTADDDTTIVVQLAATALGVPIQLQFQAGLLRAADGTPLDLTDLGPLQFTTEEGETDMPPPASTENPGRFFASIVVLADGTALVTGGLGSDGAVRADAVLVSNDLIATPLVETLATGRWAHGSVRLPDGRILIVGGFTDGAGTVPGDSAEFFDSATGLFSTADDLDVARAQFQCLPTIDGVPLVIGGLATFGGSATTATVEAWDDAQQVFATLDETFPNPLGDVAAAALADGNVFVGGGVDDSGTVRGAAFIVEPADGDVEPITATLGTPRRGAAACLLPSGDVLIVGGEAADGSKLDSLEVYETATETFRTIATATLGEARSHLQLVTLANGVIAFVGGAKDDGTGSQLLETFDPVSETIASTFTMTDAPVGHVSVPLPNGGLLSAYGASGTALPPQTHNALRSFSSAALGSDVPAPRVTTWLPAAQATGVDVDSNVVVTFSRPILASTITTSSFTLTDEEGKSVEGTRTVAPDGLSVTFDPTYPLPLLQQIDCEITTAVTDALGAAIVDDQSRKASFQTIYDMVIGSPDDGAQFGYAARTGDVNGDGIDDLVISGYVSESVPGSGIKEGQVAVIFGRTSWAASGAPIYQDMASAAGAADLLITGETHLDQLGVEGALALGDIDDDGYDDIVMGAHFADGPLENESQRGELWIVFGQETFPATTLALSGTATAGFDILRIFGTKAGDKLGEGLALGDIDDDGKPDIVTGATGDDGSAGSSTGAMYVIFGDTKAGLGVVAGYGEDVTGPSATNIDNIRIFGTNASDRLGWSCACGDFDGDGHADFAAGATGADGDTNSKSSAGEIVLVFGAPRADLIPTGSFASYETGDTTLRGLVVYGDDAVDFFGWSSLLDDLDGDGRADLAVGATSADGQDNVGDRRGEVLIVFGATRALANINATTPWRYTNAGASDVLSRRTRIYGGDDKHSFGDAILFADIDGNGDKDILIGDFQARGALDKGGSSCCWGEISVLRGTGFIPASTPLAFEVTTDGSTLPSGVTLTRFYGATKGDRAGTTLAAGDFNDDGRLDLLTGANKARGLARLFKDGGEAYVLWGRETWWK